MKKLIVAGVTVAVLAVGAFYVATHKKAAVLPQQTIALRIPDTQFMGIMPLYVAEEKGFFRQQGIAIQWIDVKDPGQAGKLLFSGQADFFMTTFANLLPAEVREPGTLRLLYGIYESSERPGSFILVRPDSPIKEPGELRGKTLGTYSGPSQKAYALMVLRKLGLKEPDDVRLIQVATSAQAQGLFGGSFDALFTVEPYGSTAISKGARVIDSGVRTKYISNPFWLGSGAVLTSFAKAHPEAVKALLEALDQAAKYIVAHDAEAREILARRTSTEQSVAQKCALYTWVAHPTKLDLTQMQEQVDFLVRENLIEKPASIANIFEGAARE